MPDPNSILGKIAMGVLRHMLTTAAGGLVAHGLITGSQEQDAIGAAMVLIGIGLSAWNKADQHAKLAAAAGSAQGGAAT